MKILIDADGCPVVDISLQVARERGVEVIILCDTSHEFEREGAITITVSKGADSVDFALVNLVLPGDIVVTQDYGLAAMSLAKKARPMHQDGWLYTSENIDALLQARHTARKIRQSGGHLRGNPKRVKENNNQFRLALENMLS